MGKAVSGLSDQYSVGVMAYRMLSGHVPFDGDSAIDILHKHCMMPAPPLDVIAAGLPPYVGWAVNKALEKDPARRFPSVKAFVEGLRHPTAEAEMSGAATVISPAPTRPRAPAPTPVTGPVKTGSRPSPSMQRMQTEIMQTGAHGTPAGGKGTLIGVALGGAAVAAANVFWLVGGSKKASAPEAQKADSAVTAPVATASPAATPAAPPAASTPAGPARITITGLPRGGSVSVDGRPQPGESFDLVDGQHQVVMQAPGYESATITVTAVAGKAQRIPFAGRAVAQAPARQVQKPLQQAAPPPPARPAPAAPTSAAGTKGILQVRVNPWANISVDGVDFPAKTGIVDTLMPGAHSVRFERDGFVTVDTVITVKAADQSRLNVRLTPKG
jgi:serine/threonine-protein kinase